ncbi:MAG: hypothetical protein M0Z94_00820 [Dehalococcoidales bacterium]|nr:hypothetical protein [Dehalococcoidales bacterium]
MAERPGATGESARAASGEGRLRVEARALVVGGDLVVSIWGGTGPHVGAAALAVPYPSRERPGATSATSSVLTLLGHKDDQVAKAAAERLAAAHGRTVVVTAGLHVDRASADDIRALIAAADRCVEQLIEHFAPG